MNYFSAYRRKLVGGFLPTTTSRIKPGQIVTFKYPTERSNPRGGGTGAIPRIVFSLNKRYSPGGLLLHGLNLEHIPWLEFRTFMRQIIVQDTLTLIKRRLELRAPINELMDRSLTFYKSKIAPQLIDHLCYRTYYTRHIRSIRLAALDYKTMFPHADSDSRSLLIEKNDRLITIPEEQKLLDKIIDVQTNKLKDAKFKKLILGRFGSIASFVRAVDDIEKYIDETKS